MNTIAAHDLKPLLTKQGEIAFLDVREQGQYGEGHPFFSVPFPYSRLEAMAATLLPSTYPRLIVFDDNDGVAERAAAVLESLGYRNVSVLEGGAPGWAAAGFTLFKGVNVMSKTYGELLEQTADTPRLTATELRSLLERDPSVVLLDGRSPEEYRKMTLPGALCCPNAELGYRLDSLVADETTTVVIHCAGRTRSILGVESLRILDIPNPLFALENGTQGWRLAGFDLANDNTPQALVEPDDNAMARMARRASALIASANLPMIDQATMAEWQGQAERTTYLLDVRTKAEFDAAHWKGARHAPGGQLIQATDQYVAVRNARIVLSDDNHVRAATTAVRLQDMGHDVYLLDADARAGSSRASADQSRAASTDEAPVFPAAGSLQELTILDASPGMSFRQAHVADARWVTRARIDQLRLDPGEPVLVTGRDRELIDGVVTELIAAGCNVIEACVGSPAIWTEAGYDIVTTPHVPTDEECIDYLFFVHDRHDGNLDAARRYLEWEVGLVDQLDAQERSVLRPRAALSDE
ncbi:MAG: rhodanese-like domain-containing protein [Acidobacteria bacterium]|nr:rhodanese-like domain-containing protein [Acidobacteriota bacterium]